MRKLFFIVIIYFLVLNVDAQSQYFGQNKQRNKANNFKVLVSPHFELYHYFNEKQASTDFLMASEKWYKLHQEVFKMAFIKPNPLILYNTHPHFQETTAIGGEIGEGTGGVTEGFRTRVVMPMMFTRRQTDHVLGHELVHAFQYQTMTYGGDSTNLASINNLPLFMVEGLAEYISIGRKDAHTAMWMRDAVYSKDIPSINDLIVKQYKYFPYRWGQAFWAYVTAKYGDDIIRPLFKETAIYGVDQAFIRAFKMDADAFSAKFKKDLIEMYAVQMPGKDTEPKGKILASEKTGSDMNVSPAISPDGKMVAYISSKNVISLDIFIADATTGKTIKRVESTSFGAHVDSYSFIETSGAWSPDSRNFAIVIQSKAKNKLLVIDVINGNKSSYDIDVESFTNPTWSPNGTSVVVAGMSQGSSDLYVFDLKTKQTSKLTNDLYSDIQPTFSPDGSYVYFVSDRGGNNANVEKENFRISRINVETKKVETLSLFESADNMNPQLSPDGQTMYFLSDPDGFRNLYSLEISSGAINKHTNFYTGISGITMYSPAMSVAAKTGEITYNYFLNGDYSIVKANKTELLNEPSSKIQNNNGAYLAPGMIQNGADIVQRNLTKPNVLVNVNPEELKSQKYNPRFKLDYLANSGMGVSTSRFGTGVGGGVTALFSDMLNNNQLMGTLALNGQIQDFGGQINYLNQKRPLQFGFSASHIPYTLGGDTKYDTTGNNGKFRLGNGLKYYNAKIEQQIIRLFIDDISAYVFRPLNKNTRLELGTSFNWYTFNLRAYPQKGQLGLTNSGIPVDFQASQTVSYRSVKLDPKQYGYNGFTLRQVFAAFVGDNTTFGTVAPLNGYRYRFEVASFSGTTSYNSILADARKYKYLKPITLAGRILYNGRLNPKNLEVLNQINPLYLGFPWYIHGFYGNALAKQQGLITQENLTGEQLGVANFEVRLPFTGPKKLALIDFQYLPSDINFFVDAGIAWSQQKKIGEVNTFNTFGNSSVTFKNTPIFTTGVSIRINVLGYLIVEPYLALPYYNGKKQALISGFNFMVPGW